jgi:hypothetical protein
MSTPLNQLRIGGGGVGVARLGKLIYGWPSCEFKFDNLPVGGIVAVDYEEKIEIDVVPSDQQDTPALGWSSGKYTVTGFSIKMLRDYADQVSTYLATKAPDLQSYGRSVFTFTAQVIEKTGIPLTLTGQPCRVIGKKDAYEEGVDELLTEFQIACLSMSEKLNGLTKRLWNGGPTLFPAADTINIGGSTAPGKWRLIEATKQYGWDIRKGQALDGATVVPTGDELIVAKFEVTLWDEAQFAPFYLLRTTYLRKALRKTSGSLNTWAIGVDHPELGALGAGDFVVKEITPLVNNGNGLWTCTVTFLQYRKPKAALSKPDAAIPAAAAPMPTAQDAQQREIQDSMNTIQGLQGQ